MTEVASELWEAFGTPDAPIAVLPESACWSALAATQVGRIAISVANEVEIFPVNYTISDRTILFRTAPGSKLLGLTVQPVVGFEIDGSDAAAAFSVAAKGRATAIESQAEIDAADLLPLTPWVPTLKYRWVRIIPYVVTGRVFRRDAEPERYV